MTKITSRSKKKLKRRPSKDEYYLDIALQVSKRATCLMRNYGAVIVKNDEIISTGYCGSPRGLPNCIDIGVCPRKEAGFLPGEGYDRCRSVHAEANAIISAERSRMLGGKIYVAGYDVETGNLVEAHPCSMCRRMIINAGLSEVVIRKADGGIKKIKVKRWIENPGEVFT